MRLLTAHRILIVAAVLCFAFYAAWELRGFARGAGGGALGRSLGAALAAVAFALYYRKIRTWR
ncbi:MAG: hypothetical protein KatS3mg076_3152 [Candidatus Binatia bacterium]|nr:MAG: hypothetical protein KatS3mg076_3152 [Candidatus Binatia bacterium]